MRSLILYLFLLAPYCAAEQSTVLQVNVKFKEYLDVPLADDCMEKIPESERVVDGMETVCWQFYTWKLYAGSVKRVISGEYKDRKIEFAVYQHAEFDRQYSKNMYIVLQELDSGRARTLGTKYYAEDYEFPKTVLCFKRPIDNTSTLFKTPDEEAQYCYDESDFKE